MALAWPRRAPHMPWHWMPAWSAALGTANACPTSQGDPKVTHETKLIDFVMHTVPGERVLRDRSPEAGGD